MASECSQEAVLCFLRERGGRVKNFDLVNHFRTVIATDAVRKAAFKEKFKGYVDNIAVVKVENGEKYVCLRKKFKEALKREKDGHHGPETSHGAVVSHDNRRDHCLTPVTPGETQSHAVNCTVPSENNDAKQEIPPASGGTPPNISQCTPDGSSILHAHKSEDNPDMGNRHIRNNSSSLQRSDKTLHDSQTIEKCVPEVALSGPSPLLVTGRSKFSHFQCLPTHTDAPSKGRVDQSQQDSLACDSALKACEEDKVDAGSGSLRLSQSLCEGGTDEGLSNSKCNTPQGRRKSFIQNLMSSSAEIRRSMVIRHSRNTAQDEEERAATMLDPVEHEWMMCCCDGEWDSLSRLLNHDPNLICKKDFVTGFSCLHWAAKLGKHELLAQIVNFARHRGLTLDVNMRSSAGYTPLHLAAMHNNIEVIKLLVGACDADVEARDFSGKKASQYLRSDVAQDVLDIAGAETTCCDHRTEELGLGDETAWRKLPRVLQANLRMLYRSASEDDERDSVGGLARDGPLRRKSSFSKLKPRLSKMRSGIPQIVHSTSHFERMEEATRKSSGQFRTRPKSDLYG